jgi:hypothetical protein
LLFGVGARAVLQSLGVAAFVAAAFYIGCIFWAWSHSAEWEPDVRQVGDEILFDLRPRSQIKTPTYGRCIVRDPNGVETVSDLLPVFAFFEVEYPRFFPGAPPVVPGEYRAMWLLAGRREDRPRVLLRKRCRVPDQAANA